MAEKAAKVGIGMTILQFVALLSLKRALSSMWVWINACQFIVYISLWQINIPTLERLITY